MKNFLNYPQSKSKEFCETLINHSDNKWKSAERESENGEYGTAISLHIISIEELIKAVIAMMDYKGFPIRSINGIQNFFKSHQIRYFTAFSIFLLGVLSEEMLKFLRYFQSNPQSFSEFIRKSEEDPQYFMKRYKFYLLRQFILFKKEVEWFSKIDYFRQEGMYSDYGSELNCPLSINRDQYLEVKSRLEKVRKMSKEIIEGFLDDSEHISKARQLAINSISREVVINNIGELIKNHKQKPFERLKKRISELE